MSTGLRKPTPKTNRDIAGSVSLSTMLQNDANWRQSIDDEEVGRFLLEDMPCIAIAIGRSSSTEVKRHGSKFETALEEPILNYPVTSANLPSNEREDGAVERSIRYGARNVLESRKANEKKLLLHASFNTRARAQYRDRKVPVLTCVWHCSPLCLIMLRL